MGEALRPTHIVNCTPDHPEPFSERAAYHRVAVVDEPGEGLLEKLDDAVAFIEEAVQQGGTVLCHCRHGQSRSASVLVAWMVRSRGYTVNDSLEMLKRCRPRVSPNEGFR